MMKTVEAIYEDGVLKPVERLELADHQRVELTLRVIPGDARGSDGSLSTRWSEMEATSEARLAALDALFDEIDRADLKLDVPLPTRDELHERP